jgi:hypothetical protein
MIRFIFESLWEKVTTEPFQFLLSIIMLSLFFIVSVAFLTAFLMGIFYCPFKILGKGTPLLYRILLLIAVPLLDVEITRYFTFHYHHNIGSMKSIGWPIPIVVFDAGGSDYPGDFISACVLNFVFYFAWLSFLLWSIIRLHLRFRKAPQTQKDPAPQEAATAASTPPSNPEPEK